MSWESLMADFAPYIFVLIGVVISYSLYKMFTDSDLRIFLLLNAIVQFIIAGTTANAVCVIVAILSLLPLILMRKTGEAETDE